MADVVIPITGWYIRLKTGELLPVIAASVADSNLIPWVSTHGGEPEKWTIGDVDWVHESQRREEIAKRAQP